MNLSAGIRIKYYNKICTSHNEEKEDNLHFSCYHIYTDSSAGYIEQKYGMDK